MTRRKLVYSLLLLLFLFGVIFSSVIYFEKNQKLKVIFLDVGQGDSILIERGSTQILIDGGPDGQAVLEKLGKYIPFWDRQIEAVIATHPDQDHIDGLISVMEKYEVMELIDNGVSSESQIYKKFKETIQERNISELEGKIGMKLKIGEGAELDVLYPDGNQPKDSPKDTNASSIVARLSYGENTFLFTGDLPFEGEDLLFRSGANLKSKVLKVAHHGSKYATSEDFLSALEPEEAVISVGKNNRYGHPNQETLDRISARGVNIRRTDEEGDVEYEL